MPSVVNFPDSEMEGKTTDGTDITDGQEPERYSDREFLSAGIAVSHAVVPAMLSCPIRDIRAISGQNPRVFSGQPFQRD